MLHLGLQAPAKINLCLHVLGRYPDGYHALAMAMQQVSLYDRIELRVRPQGNGTIHCTGVPLRDGEENLAARAARLLLRETGCTPDVELHIDKRIPMAAGLGGGSSDAASVLRGLVEVLKLNIGDDRLMELGSRLGADVPFFLFGPSAWATGTGTTLQSLPDLPEVAYLLVNPGIQVSTAEVYRSLQLTKGGDLANLPRFSVTSRAQLCAQLHNDLESVTLQRLPELRRIKQRLLEVGALGALMSGSGPTLFGVFEDEDAADSAAEFLRADFPDGVFSVRPL